MALCRIKKKTLLSPRGSTTMPLLQWPDKFSGDSKKICTNLHSTTMWLTIWSIFFTSIKKTTTFSSTNLTKPSFKVPAQLFSLLLKVINKKVKKTTLWSLKKIPRWCPLFKRTALLFPILLQIANFAHQKRAHHRSLCWSAWAENQQQVQNIQKYSFP